MIKIRQRAWDERAAQYGYAVTAKEAAMRLRAQAFEVDVIDGGISPPGPVFYSDDAIEHRATEAMTYEKVAPPAKRKPGRPATGQTPVQERKEKSLAKLARAGGRRLEIRLTPDGAKHLDEVHKDHPGLNDTEAMLLALRWYASRRSRKPRE